MEKYFTGWLSNNNKMNLIMKKFAIIVWVIIQIMTCIFIYFYVLSYMY